MPRTPAGRPPADQDGAAADRIAADRVATDRVATDRVATDRATAISAELAALLDTHLNELRSRGVSELVLEPLELELRRYSA